MVKGSIIKDDSINLIELVKTVLTRRKVVFFSVTISVLFGLLIALTSKIEYKSSIKLIPSSNSSIKPGLGSLSSLAGLAGINLGSVSDDIVSPEVYPEIIYSVPFMIDLLDEEVYYSKIDTTISSYNFFKEFDRISVLGFIIKYTIGLPFQIKSFLIKDGSSGSAVLEDNVIKISKEDSKIIERFKDRITINFNDESGVLSITLKMPDPNVSAVLANRTYQKLQEHIINFKTLKAKENLEFIVDRYNESKLNYKKLQNDLAIYTDQNKNVLSARVQIEQQNIQNEYNIAYEVYKSLASQLEQSKIQVKENSPVLSVIDPAKVPVEKSEPRRLLILVIFAFLGLFIGLGIILLQESILDIINLIKR